MAFKNLRENIEKQDRETKHQMRPKVKKEIIDEHGIKQKPKREDLGKWVRNFEDYTNEDDDLDIE